MTDLITNIKEIIMGLPKAVQGIIIVLLIGATVLYGYWEFNKPSEEVTPNVEKKVEVGTVNGGIQGGFNITQ